MVSDSQPSLIQVQTQQDLINDQTQGLQHYHHLHFTYIGTEASTPQRGCDLLQGNAVTTWNPGFPTREKELPKWSFIDSKLMIQTENES